jgi:hypothetical protein
MRLFKIIDLALAILALSGTVNAGSRVQCETERGQIGWCMNQYDPNDRADCSLRYFDWDDPADGECFDDFSV